jgi:hypothetical protein
MLIMLAIPHNLLHFSSSSTEECVATFLEALSCLSCEQTSSLYADFTEYKHMISHVPMLTNLHSLTDE